MNTDDRTTISLKSAVEKGGKRKVARHDRESQGTGARLERSGAGRPERSGAARLERSGVGRLERTATRRLSRDDAGLDVGLNGGLNGRRDVVHEVNQNVTGRIEATTRKQRRAQRVSGPFTPDNPPPSEAPPGVAEVMGWELASRMWHEHLPEQLLGVDCACCNNTWPCDAWDLANGILVDCQKSAEEEPV